MPLAVIAAVKKHPLYRRIHCHIASACPEDGWIEENEDLAFVLFALRGAHGDGPGAGFAIKLSTLTVVGARMLQRTPAGLWTKPLEEAPPCAHAESGVPETSLPLVGLGFFGTPHKHDHHTVLR